jgi:predicted molibdopterin-dependent oxidoreductase YjgC
LIRAGLKWWTTPHCGPAEKPGNRCTRLLCHGARVLKEGLYNREFIASRTENFEEFAASMEKFTPEYAEGISGVDRN